ncbi:hypothetical protein BMH25_01645 [Leucobacter sp. OLCALW19]|nr:hypothetical protein BMH25_01645 [Leucobacter sp. OLCALW19]
MVLSIVGLVLCFLPFLGIPLAFVGIVLSIVAMVKKQPKGFSLTGLIVGILGLVAGVVIVIVALLALGAVGNAAEQCANGAATVEIAGQTIDCSSVDITTTP